MFLTWFTNRRLFKTMVVIVTLCLQWFVMKATLFAGFPSLEHSLSGEVVVFFAPFVIGAQVYLILWPGCLRVRWRMGLIHSLVTVPLQLFYMMSSFVSMYYFPEQFRTLTFWAWLWQF